MKRLIYLLVAMTAGLAMIASGQTPTLYGSQVTYIGYYPTLENPVTIPNTVTVGPGIEFPVGSIEATNGLPLLNGYVDVGPSSIDIQYTENQTALVAPFNGAVLTFNSSSPVITGLSLSRWPQYFAHFLEPAMLGE